jgi:ATP-dependent Clp protease ATP-binding subunit ClpC
MFLVYRLSEARARLIKIRKVRANGQVGEVEVSAGLNLAAEMVLEEAYLIAAKFNQPEVLPIHLFWALLKDPKVRIIFIRLSLDLRTLLEKLSRYLGEAGTEPLTGTGVSLAAQKILLLAYIDAKELKQTAVDPFNILFHAYSASELVLEILYDFEITDSKMKNAIIWLRTNEKIVANYRIYRRLARLKPGSNMNRAYTAIATPTIDHFSRDLTAMAKYGYFEICLGRDKETKAIFDALESGQNGILLVGPVGVGKTAVIEGLAQLMVKEEVPLLLQDKRLVQVDVSRLIGGTTPAEAQDRLLAIINEAVRSQNVVLVIDNLEQIMGISSGGAGSLELSEVLADALSQQTIICLATATSENYAKYIESHLLGSILTTVGISEPGLDQAIQMLESKVGFLEGKYGVYFDYNAVEQAAVLTSRYINDEFLPSKALKVLQLTAVKVSKICAHNSKLCLCTKNDVATVVSETTGIPVSKVSEGETEKLLNLEDSIHRRMIGQEEAVKAIAGSLRRARAEMRESKRPIASFLFLGPTGVGKTELAKSVAEVYFGDEDCMIRLDMSEYQLADSVTKMIGDADSLGYLTEAVRKKPFSLILLDEVEKANADVLNLFLQMMDDGRLTDGQGRTINFTNSIIVATSNAGALYIEAAVQEGIDINIIKQEIVDNQLNKFMRPELINRFDGVIVFKPLSFANVVAIAKLMLQRIAKSLEGKGVGLAPTQAGVERLAQLGYDPKFGARPLRRLLQDKIENEIANLVLGGKLRRRDTVIINEQGEIEVQKGREL